MLSTKKYMKCLAVTFLLIFLFLMPSFGQNITKPKIACPNGLWVNSYNGVLFFARTDLKTENSAIPLQTQFYYNSSYANINYGFGYGFSLGYEMRCKTDLNGVTVERGDGRKDFYTRFNNVFLAPVGVFDELTQIENGKYLIANKSGAKYYFEDITSGLVTRIADKNDNEIKFTYDKGLLTEVSDSKGRTIQFKWEDSLMVNATASFSKGSFSYKYDTKRRLTKITDPMGYSTLNGYDESNRLIQVTDPEGCKTTISYNSNGAVFRVKTAVTDKVIRYEQEALRTVIIDYTEPASQFSYYKWDTLGRVIEKNGLCCGMQEMLTYDKDNNILSRTDANGNVRTYTYDQQGNMTSATDPEGNVERYTYGSTFNQVASYTDKNGNTYTFLTDTKGNLAKLTGPENLTTTYTYNENGLPETIMDAKGNVSQNTYDETGHLLTLTDAAGYIKRFEYDMAGNLVSSTDGCQNTTKYQYDNNNQLLSTTDPLGNTKVYSYDRCGNIVRFKDAANRITACTYDALGHLLTRTDPSGKIEKYVYNGKGKPILMINQIGDTTRLTYNDRDRVTSVLNPAHEMTTFDYDKKGNLVSILQPNGNVISYNFTINDLIESVADNVGTLLQKTYDANGNILTEIDAENRTTTYRYDNLNRKIQVTDPSGNSDSYTYDANSNLVSHTNRNGYTERVSYNSVNLPENLTDALSATTHYEYDAEGNLLNIVDVKGNKTSYVYDAVGRKTQMNFANGTFSQYWYDAVSNMTKMKDKKGNVVDYSYDVLNRLEIKEYPDGKSDRFSYNTLGQLVSAINGNATVTFGYDKAGRVQEETLNGQYTKYSYDLSNLKRTITYPGRKEVVEDLNKRDQIIRITEDENVAAEMLYNKAGQLISRNYRNGTSTTYAYNNNGWICGINDGVGIGHVAMIYDKAGNILTRIDSMRLDRTEQYTYDELQRLVEFKRGTPTNNIIATPLQFIQYKLDALGNRVTVQDGEKATSYVSNTVNQYTSITGGVETTTNYDLNGNLLRDFKHNYQYDFNNKLIKVDEKAAFYYYDALGRRISKVTPTDTVHYFYAGKQVIEEQNASDAVQATYLFGNGLDEVLEMNRNNNSYFYHQNHLGSVMAMTGIDGSLQESYQYDPYGSVTFFNASGNALAHSSLVNNTLFTGRTFDTETGNYDYRARTMQPELGRFLQPDPLLFVDGMNYYNYVGGNPVMYVDPYGLAKECGSPDGDYCEKHPFLCHSICAYYPLLCLVINGADFCMRNPDICNKMKLEGKTEICSMNGKLGGCVDANISLGLHGLEIGRGATSGFGTAKSASIDFGIKYDNSKNINSPDLTFRAKGEVGKFGAEYSYNPYTRDHELTGSAIGSITMNSNGSLGVSTGVSVGGGSFIGIRAGEKVGVNW